MKGVSTKIAETVAGTFGLNISQEIKSGISKGISSEFKSSSIVTAIKTEGKIRRTIVRNIYDNIRTSLYKFGLALERFADPKTSAKVKKATVSDLTVDFFANKAEQYGVENAGQYKKFADEIFAPVVHDGRVFKGENNKGNVVAINRFFSHLKKTLLNVNGSNRDFIGNTTNPGDAAIKVGKSTVNFIKDAAKEQGVKRTWLASVLFVAVPVVTLSLIAISQFGKKNKYNPDIYEVKDKPEELNRK